MRPHEAAFALGSEKLFMEVVAAGWILPVVQRHKLTLYDAGDVAKVWARILRGENPSDTGIQSTRAGVRA